jgi:3-oxoacyl-[acyl-carrier protein] reductase
MRLFVTGAARGIGAAIVKRALTDGHEVVAADIDRVALENHYRIKGSPSDAELVRLDVRDAGSWVEALDSAERKGPIDVLANVAGVLRPGRTGEIPPEDVDAQIDVNVKGVIHGTNEMAKRMRARRRGHIVNIGSTASLFATPGNTVYSASKHAVRGFSIAAAGDLRPYGIAVTLLGPTATRTDMLELQRGREESALTFSGARALHPDEVASAMFDDVLTKKPLELYLPRTDQWIGKLATALPRIFLRATGIAHKRGLRNFESYEFRDQD